MAKSNKGSGGKDTGKNAGKAAQNNPGKSAGKQPGNPPSQSPDQSGNKEQVREKKHQDGRSNPADQRRSDLSGDDDTEGYRRPKPPKKK